MNDDEMLQFLESMNLYTGPGIEPPGKWDVPCSIPVTVQRFFRPYFLKKVFIDYN